MRLTIHPDVTEKEIIKKAARRVGLLTASFVKMAAIKEANLILGELPQINKKEEGSENNIL